MIVKSLWHLDNETMIQSEEVLNPDSRFLQVESAFSLISLGTEQLVLQRKIPQSIQSEMKVPYMKGSFDLPIKYGYALSGVLENGQKIHIMHPHQNLCFVNRESLFVECQELPLYRIPLISNMETVINAIWDSDINKYQDILICGFGGIGALLAFTLKFHYKFKNIFISENNPYRKQKALDFGFYEAEQSLKYDISFNTTSSEKAMQFCINHSKEEAKIVELSWYGNKNININLGGNFHKNRLQIIASQVSKIPLKMRNEYDYEKRKVLASTILKNDIFDQLLTEPIPFEKVPDFFNDLRQNKISEGIIQLIKY